MASKRPQILAPESSFIAVAVDSKPFGVWPGSRQLQLY